MLSIHKLTIDMYGKVEGYFPFIKDFLYGTPSLGWGGEPLTGISFAS